MQFSPKSFPIILLDTIGVSTWRKAFPFEVTVVEGDENAEQNEQSGQKGQTQHVPD